MKFPKIHVHTLVKNEELLLDTLLPYWSRYPVERFIFFDDQSTDSTRYIINRILGSRATIISDREERHFNESLFRSRMIEASGPEPDLIIALDADEVLTANFFSSINSISRLASDFHCRLRWYNLAGTLYQVRGDPAYANNFVQAIAKPKNVFFDFNKKKFHECPRLPQPTLPLKLIDGLGIIHFQSLNVKYYALKQLWYKHYEYVVNNRSVQEINLIYDQVVNGLNFEIKPISSSLIGDLKIDPTLFDILAEKKGYKQFILDNLNKDLLTFGTQYL